jgi:hypothetical protein
MTSCLALKLGDLSIMQSIALSNMTLFIFSSF